MSREAPLLSKELNDYLRYDARPEKKTVEIYPSDSRYAALREAAIADGRDPDECLPNVTWIELSVMYFIVGFTCVKRVWNAVWEPFIRCDRPGGVNPNEDFRKLIAETLGVSTDDLLVPISAVKSGNVPVIRDGVVENEGYWEFA